MGILTVQRDIEELSRVKRSFARGVGGLTIFLVIISFIVEAKLLRAHIVTPISVIAKEADRFARENTRGSYDLRDYDYSVKEIYEMSSAIETMEEDTLKNIENIKTIVSEQERIGADLELASRIQFSMLPKEDQIKEDINEYDIEAVMQPAREVGGDFYDFYMISENELVIEIADVSDKGLAAAFFMAITKTLIASRAGMGGEASEIISYVDKMVSEKNDTGMFVTVWFAIINLETGYVKVCNSGHDYPAIMKDGQDYVIEKTPHGPPIGFIPGATFVDYDFYIKPGDRIFLYTDGLNEAKRSDGERFGLERVLTVLNSQKDSSNKQLIAAMKDSVKMFVGNEPQFDDTTMLSFTFKNYKKS
jgi:serine phosphatase RsbU (regulator of sigma subunit)